VANMTKAEVVAKIAEKAGITKREVDGVAKSNHLKPFCS